MVHHQRQDSHKKFEELKGEVTLSRAQVQSMVETINILIAEVVALKEDVDKKGEKNKAPGKGKAPSQLSNPPTHPRHVPQVIPLSRGQSLSRTPKSSSGVTPTGSRLLVINDPGFLNINLYGINIKGEK